MNKKLKLDITGLIGAVVLICICIAAIVVTLIGGLCAGLTLAIVIPYVIIIVFSLYFVWSFIDAIFVEYNNIADKTHYALIEDLKKKDEEIKQLKAKLEKANVLHKKRKK